MTGYLNSDDLPDDLDTPVEVLRSTLDSATRALDSLTVSLEALTSSMEARPDTAAAGMMEKAEAHRRYLQQFIGQATATAEVVERHPDAEAHLAEDLLDLAHSLAEDTETAAGWAHFLGSVAEVALDDAELDRWERFALWAALLAAKSARTAEHLTYARRVHLRALTAVRSRPGRKVHRPRTPDARRRRCQLARAAVGPRSDDPLPARGARCPTREPLSRLAPTHERSRAPTSP